VLIKLLPLLLLTLLIAASLSAQDVEAQFATNKTDYLVGEPLFVTLTVTNRGDATIWVDFKSPDAPSFCENFALEVPGAELPDHWGCGYAGSCASSFREIPPGKSLALRRLLNTQFRLQRPGTYAVHAHTNLVVHNQDLFDSPPIEQFEVTDTLTLELHSSNESQLKAAFQPFVEDLRSPDATKRAEAASAITVLAPPFLEDVLVEMSKSSYASAAIVALREADTPKTREALASIATGSGDSALRIEAISNLGRTGDAPYLRTLTQLLASDDRSIQNAAAEAAGVLGGSAAFAQIVALVSSSDAQTRVAGADGLGHTRARQAVPVLIQMLLDSDPNVRQAAVNSLSLLTHRVAFYGDEWSDVTNPQFASDVHQRWVRWWSSHADDSKIYGIADCAGSALLD
jgi:hypothetical protein